MPNRPAAMRSCRSGFAVGGARPPQSPTSTATSVPRKKSVDFDLRPSDDDAETAAARRPLTEQAASTRVRRVSAGVVAEKGEEKQEEEEEKEVVEIQPEAGDGVGVTPHGGGDAGIIGQIYSLFQASDNKLAMKLFGSKNAVLREQQRQLAARSWIIHPCSNFKLFWDVVMLIFLATNLVVLPVSIAFFLDDEDGHWTAFNGLCDVMFFLDILVSFRTGMLDATAKNEVILDGKLIARRYVRTWFVVDVVSTFPLDYVLLAVKDGHFSRDYTTGRALRILRLAKLLQLIRILRISRLLRYIKVYQEFLSIASTMVRIFNLLCVMVLLSHWSGCLQFFVPVLQGWPDDSWIVRYQLQGKPWWEQYSVALFKALSHMLCIGYGQYAPANITDTWLTMLSMLAGASCYAMLVGHTTALIQSFDVSSRLYRSHLQQVNEYMIYRKLPSNTRKRITDYYDHRYGGKMFNEAEIMSELSDSLKQEIVAYNCRKLLDTVPFFKNADDNFVDDVIMKLKFEFMQPGDVIIRLGSVMHKIYFIQEGWLHVLNSAGSVVTTLGYGSYFGELGLLTGQKSAAEIRAATHCNLFSTTYEEFETVLEKYPIVRRTLQTIARKRLHDLGEDPSALPSCESLADGMHEIFGLSAAATAAPEGGSDDGEGCVAATLAVANDDEGCSNSYLSDHSSSTTTAQWPPQQAATSTRLNEKRQLLVVLKEFFTKESAALPMPYFEGGGDKVRTDVQYGRGEGSSRWRTSGRPSISAGDERAALGNAATFTENTQPNGCSIKRSLSSRNIQRRVSVDSFGRLRRYGGGDGFEDHTLPAKRSKSVRTQPQR